MPNRASERARQRDELRRNGELERDRIVSAAVRLADREGLEAVSIRRLAGELRVRPMSLYTYIASKDDLLSLMRDAVVAEVIIGEELPPDWRAALRVIATRSRHVFVSHPWILEISGGRPNLGHNALRHAEQLLAAVSSLRLDPSDAWQVLFIVNDYTLGHALRLAHSPGGVPSGYPSFDPVRFPHLSNAEGGIAAQRDMATFEKGLDALLAGIEARFGN